MPRILNHPDTKLGSEDNEINVAVLGTQEHAIWQLLRILDMLATAPTIEGGPRVRAKEDSKKLRQLQDLARKHIVAYRDPMVGVARLVANLSTFLRREPVMTLRAGGWLTDAVRRDRYDNGS